MARHIGGIFTLALLMVAGGGGFSISQKKRPLSGHSATLEHIGVDILWANAALAAHAYNIANRSSHTKISPKSFMTALLSSPFSNNWQKGRQKRRAKSAKANSSNQWPSALSKW